MPLSGISFAFPNKKISLISWTISSGRIWLVLSFIEIINKVQLDNLELVKKTLIGNPLKVNSLEFLSGINPDSGLKGCYSAIPFNSFAIFLISSIFIKNTFYIND